MIPTVRATVQVCGKPFKAHHVMEPAATGIRNELRRLSLDDHPRSRLPGPNPVSIERADFQTLKTAEYVACEKTDGVRFVAACMRYEGLKIMVLVDRAMEVYLFPLRKIPRPLFQGTIVDGELAWDKSRGAFAFLAFDAVTVSGVSVGHFGLPDRIAAMKKAFELHAPHEDDPAAFSIKGFIPLKATTLIESHLREVSTRFDVDGVILTPVHEEVRYGRHPRLFKLKTVGKHTVDFIASSDGRLMVYDSRSKQHVAVGQMMVGIPAEGTVVECSHMGNGDPSIKYWKLETVRADKKTANDVLTYEKTMLNMRENIAMKDVLSLF